VRDGLAVVPGSRRHALRELRSINLSLTLHLEPESPRARAGQAQAPGGANAGQLGSAEPALPRAEDVAGPAALDAGVPPAQQLRKVANGVADARRGAECSAELAEARHAATNGKALQDGRPEASGAGEVDLRSDTVTRPTPAMRRAMAEVLHWSKRRRKHQVQLSKVFALTLALE